MSLPSRFSNWRHWAAWLALLLAGSTAIGAELKLPRQGWASWRVAAVAGAPDWCCFDRNPSTRSCALDGRNQGYGSRSEDASVSQMQIYARFNDGKLERVRAYGPSCAVTASSPVTDLGEVDSEASARWLASAIAPRSDHSADVLAALASHAGASAEAALERTASSDPTRANRKDAIFWLGHLRGEPGTMALLPLLQRDPDAAIREHAAFAIAQGKSPRRGELLIRQAQTDASAKVRSQAWFWLAQTGDSGAERAILAALKAERSQEVRHQAIFALSQLPDQRAVNALIALLEDRSVGIDERKQALFWLGQDESAAAQQYLAKVLGA